LVTGCNWYISHEVWNTLLRHNEINASEKHNVCISESCCEHSASKNTKSIVVVSVTRAREVGSRRCRHCSRAVADPRSYIPTCYLRPRLTVSPTTRRITATQSDTGLGSLFGTINSRYLADLSPQSPIVACIHLYTTRDPRSTPRASYSTVSCVSPTNTNIPPPSLSPRS
jgi:hypothetical protein